MNKTKTDVFIIGAGPAGSLAAAMLQQQGWQVEIAEKQQFPRFVIGESLLPRVMDNLQKANLLQAIEAQNFQIKRGARFTRDGILQEFDFSDQHTQGWSWTWQVPRADFDKALVDEVQKRGVKVTYRESVEAVSFSNDGALVALKNAAGEQREVEARFVIDASGYGRVLPRLLDLDMPSNFPVRHAFFSHFHDVNRPQDHSAMQIMIVLHPKAWIWVIPFSTGITSVGFVAEPDFFASFPGKNDEAKLRAIIDTVPEIRQRFNPEVKLAFKEPQTIEGYSIKVKKMFGEKFVLAGNATEFLDPVLSSGVMFAIESGTRAGEMVHQYLSGAVVDWERDYVQYMQRGIDVFRTYVSSWYNGDLPTIFFADDQNPTIKRYICSVLAGYAWDLTNPYVAQHQRAVPTLAEVLRASGM